MFGGFPRGQRPSTVPAPGRPARPHLLAPAPGAPGGPLVPTASGPRADTAALPPRTEEPLPSPSSVPNALTPRGERQGCVLALGTTVPIASSTSWKVGLGARRSCSLLRRRGGSRGPHGGNRADSCRAEPRLLPPMLTPHWAVPEHGQWRPVSAACPVQPAGVRCPSAWGHSLHFPASTLWGESAARALCGVPRWSPEALGLGASSTLPDGH